MKTPAEWLALIKQASEREVRHGSTVFLTEADIQAILLDGWKNGMTDAAMAIAGGTNLEANLILRLRNSK